MNNNYEQYVILILSLIIIIFLILIVFIAARITFVDDIPTIVEHLEPSTLKTGDIVATGYNNPFGGFVTAWSGSIWSHVGIIWVHPRTDQVFVLEAAMYGGEYNGVFKIPLEIWISVNKKSYIGLIRIKGRLDPLLLIRKFNERKSYVILDKYNLGWHRLLKKTPYYHEIRKNYTCYELVVSVLQDCEVIKKLHTCSSYFPGDIMKSNIPLEEKYSYTCPVLLNTDNYYLLKKINGDDSLKNE